MNWALFAAVVFSILGAALLIAGAALTIKTTIESRYADAIDWVIGIGAIAAGAILIGAAAGLSA